jgi:hypothetical protein
MGTSEEGSTISSELERDIETLSASALREKYDAEASSHRNMKRRCGDGDFTYDPAWSDFRTFLRDMGAKPSPLWTLDRIDGRVKHYGPGAVRWADKATQTDNRSNTQRLVFDGEEMTLADFAKRIGKPYQTVYSAIRRGEAPGKIAQHHAPSASTDWRHPNPANEALFWERYGKWKRKLQPRYRRYEHPAIYYLFSCYAVWVEAEKGLEAKGLYETSSEDVEGMATLTSSTAYAARSTAQSRAKETLEWISVRDPSLALGLQPTGPSHLATLANLIDEAVKPDARDFPVG